jgi:PII interaction protein X
MINETYLTHPNFGLLFSLCRIDPNQSLYTTLYAQRLFFIVSISDERLSFISISRQEAKSTVENRMRDVRHLGLSQEFKEIQIIYKQTFQ